MTSKPKLSLEQQIDLQQIVAEEIEQHRRREITELTSNKKIGIMYNLSIKAIYCYLRKLIPEEDLSYRASILRSDPIKKLHADPEFQEAIRERMKKLNADAEFKEANRERMKRLRGNPEIQAAQRESMKRLHVDPDYQAAQRESLKKLNADAEFKEACRKRSRDIMKRLHANPEFQEAQRERMKRLHANPEFQEANKKRASKIMKELHANPEFQEANKERIKRLNADPEYQAAQRERMKKLNANPEFQEAQREAMKKLNADPEFQAANRERGRIVIKKLNADPEFQERHRKRNIKTIESYRKNSYFVESRFYASSLQEGSVALLLEKYLNKFFIRDSAVYEDINFQVRNKGISNGGIDFLVNDEFLEWHPITLYYGKRGDISSKEEKNSYKKVRESLPKHHRREFDNEYKRVLAINYRHKRQSDVGTSEYSGKSVNLATTEQELYDFISKHSDRLPSYEEFKREFKMKCKYIKSFKVESKSQKAMEEIAV